MKEVMNLQEAMNYLDFKAESCFRRKCRRKEIPCRYIGKEYRFSKTALDMWLAGMDLKQIYSKMAEIQLEKAMLVMA